jgi:hypothetical protein
MSIRTVTGVAPHAAALCGTLRLFGPFGAASERIAHHQLWGAVSIAANGDSLSHYLRDFLAHFCCAVATSLLDST